MTYLGAYASVHSVVEDTCSEGTTVQFYLDVGNLTADYPSHNAQSAPAYTVLSLRGTGGLGPLMRHSQVSARAGGPCSRVLQREQLMMWLHPEQ